MREWMGWPEKARKRNIRESRRLDLGSNDPQRHDNRRLLAAWRLRQARGFEIPHRSRA